MINTFAATAERLRETRTAEEDFLGLYAIDCIFSQEKPLSSLAQDLWAASSSAGAGVDEGGRNLFAQRDLDDL